MHFVNRHKYFKEKIPWIGSDMFAFLEKFNPYLIDDDEKQNNRDEINWKIYSSIYDKISDFKTLDYQFYVD